MQPYHQSSMHFHGVAFNYLSTGTTLLPLCEFSTYVTAIRNHLHFLHKTCNHTGTPDNPMQQMHVEPMPTDVSRYRWGEVMRYSVHNTCSVHATRSSRWMCTVSATRSSCWTCSSLQTTWPLLDPTSAACLTILAAVADLQTPALMLPHLQWPCLQSPQHVLPTR